MNLQEKKYVDYPVYGGLQRPLEFMGFRGRYIYWAAGTVGGGILGFIIGYVVAGFLVGLGILTLTLAFGGVTTFVKQHKGLHSKGEKKGIFIFAHSRHI